MLLADRVKDDLAGGGAGVEPDAAHGERRSTAREAGTTRRRPASRGGVLFESWWRLYTQGANRRLPVRASRGAREARDDAARPQGSGARRARIRVGGRRDGDATAIRHRVGRCAPRADGEGGRAGRRLQRRARLLPRAQLQQRTRTGSGRSIGGDGWVLAVEFGDGAAGVLGARVRAERAGRTRRSTATRRRCSRKAR